MRPPNVPAKSSSIPPSPAIRKSSPIRPIPGRSSSSPTRKSAITEPVPTITKSARPYIEGLVVREFSAITSNWRSDSEANDFLARRRHPRRRRSRYPRAGPPSAHARRDARRAFGHRKGSREAGREGALHSHHGRARSGQPRLHPRSATNGPTRSTPARPPNSSASCAEPRYHVVAYDFGIKHNILRRLVQSAAA